MEYQIRDLLAWAGTLPRRDEHLASAFPRPLTQGALARGTSGSAGWSTDALFSQRPWLACVVGTEVALVKRAPLVLGSPRVASCVAVRSGNRPAESRRWASRCGDCKAVAHVRRASAATPRRIVRFTRSIKAVFTRPEKPSTCSASRIVDSLPNRITDLTRTSFRRRYFLMTCP